MDKENQTLGFFGNLISGATAAFTSRQETEQARREAEAAQYASAASATKSNNFTKIALIGGGVLAVIVVLFLVFKK